MNTESANENRARWSELLAHAFDNPGELSKAYGLFWDYSFGNQLLALMQCANRGIQPGPIASFMKWKDLGRSVKKGEKAISLLMPVTMKRRPKEGEAVNADENGGTFRLFVMRRNWFVLSQTDGEAFTPPPAPAWDRDTALRALEVEEIPFTHTNGNAQGFAKCGRQLAISPIAAFPLKTTFHELAHILLGHTEEKSLWNDDETTPRNLREVEAESVAMLCLDALGIEGGHLCRGYIQSWAQGITAIPEKSAQKIMSAADKILRAGRGEPIANTAPRHITHELALA